MTGRELAIYASADAFELFTGMSPCTAEMGIAFDDVMAKKILGAGCGMSEQDNPARIQLPLNELYP